MSQPFFFVTRRYLLPTFLGAFLLFAVQPMAGKRVLPPFGGGPAVWTTCMLLFQALLLAGYAYAHLVSTRLTRRAQITLHMALLGASVVLLPRMAQPETWKSPAGLHDPAWAILLLLASTIGLPYFMLSTTGPLIQAWARDNEASPYRLYALSNAASFLALVSYPFAVEPWISVRHQFWIWSALYLAYVAATAGCALRSRIAPAVQAAVEPLAPLTILYWIALAACGSTVLLAVTNQMCQEVAVIPFLWILPLALYLLTFTICFDHERWYSRKWWGLALAILGPTACAILAMGIQAPLAAHILVDTLVLVACCMICHGELAQSKPAPARLTSFYLAIAAGGALGGVFVAIVAPRVFSDFTEFPLALAACALLALDAWRRAGAFRAFNSRPLFMRSVISGLAMASLVAMVSASEGASDNDLRTVRNFYGILRIADKDLGDKSMAKRTLTHGRILHGFQYLSQEKRGWPTTYFGEHTGIGLTMQFHPRRFSENQSLKAGVIGLGAGTIAAYGHVGDVIQFYEINPAVDDLSRDYFTYRRDSMARVTVALSAARVVLDSEPSQEFDVLAVDAFSSDAIPAHLLTAECAEIYRRHLKPDGVLAVHISNRSLDLSSVVRGLAAHLGWRAGLVTNPLDLRYGVVPATWVLVSNNQAFWDSPVIRQGVTPWTVDSRPPLVWTDDFTSLWRVLKFQALSTLGG